jgi:hypothetical protein
MVVRPYSSKIFKSDCKASLEKVPLHWSKVKKYGGTASIRPVKIDNDAIGARAQQRCFDSLNYAQEYFVENGPPSY